MDDIMINEARKQVFYDLSSVQNSRLLRSMSAYKTTIIQVLSSYTIPLSQLYANHVIVLFITMIKFLHVPTAR